MDFVALMRQHQVPFAPVNDIAGFLADPQVQHNGTYYDVEDAEFGTMRHLNFMAAFADTPSTLLRRAPKIGEHTDEVLKEFGYSKAVVADFRAGGFIR